MNNIVYKTTSEQPEMPVSYWVYSVTRWEFVLPKLLQIYKSVLSNSAIKWGFLFHLAIKVGFLFQNNHKYLNPSYKMDLDL